MSYVCYMCYVSYMNHLKLFWYSKYFYQYIRTENLSYKIPWNYLKNHLNCFHKLLKNFCEFIRTKNLSYKIAWNYSKITWIVLNTISSFFFDQNELHILLTKTKIYRNNFKKDIIKRWQNKYKSLTINLEC